MAAHSQLAQRLIELVRERGTRGTLTHLLSASDMPEGATYAGRLGEWAHLPVQKITLHTVLRALLLGQGLPLLSAHNDTKARTQVWRFGGLRADAIVTALAALGCKVGYYISPPIFHDTTQAESTWAGWYEYMSRRELGQHIRSFAGVGYPWQLALCESEDRRMPYLSEALDMLLVQVISARLDGISLNAMVCELGSIRDCVSAFRIRCAEKFRFPARSCPMQSVTLGGDVLNCADDAEPEFWIGHCFFLMSRDDLGTIAV